MNTTAYMLDCLVDDKPTFDLLELLDRVINEVVHSYQSDELEQLYAKWAAQLVERGVCPKCGEKLKDNKCKCGFAKEAQDGKL